jgi:hypothetical protein
MGVFRIEADATELTLDVSNWPPGVYFVKTGNMQVGKFSIQR